MNSRPADESSVDHAAPTSAAAPSATAPPKDHDETMERLRSDPWLQAFVASKRRRPFARQRARDLAAALEARSETSSNRSWPEAPDAPDDEVVTGRAKAPCCASGESRPRR